MINNYLQTQYKPWDKVYTHQKYNTSIFLGGIEAARDIDFIIKEKIYTIITATIGAQDLIYQSPITHLVYPLQDSKSQDISRFFLHFIELMDNALAKGNVLVHCFAGVSRSATLVISYLMKTENWNFKTAIAYVRQSRSIVCPNLGFQRQLKTFQKILLTRKTSILSQRIIQIRKSDTSSNHRKNQYAFPELTPLSVHRKRGKVVLEQINTSPVIQHQSKQLQHIHSSQHHRQNSEDKNLIIQSIAKNRIVYKSYERNRKPKNDKNSKKINPSTQIKKAIMVKLGLLDPKYHSQKQEKLQQFNRKLPTIIAHH